MRPFAIDLEEELSHAHPQILRLSEKVYILQPPYAPGDAWIEMQAVVWAIEKTPDGQVSVKYRVDPRDDHDMLEGCPLLKQLAGRRYVPVGLHVGRFAEGEALAEACEGRGVSAVLALLDGNEHDTLRRLALAALARLASENHFTLLEVGKQG
ncbi:unnamed protein product, partial [Sphacelaria rigidula]